MTAITKTSEELSVSEVRDCLPFEQIYVSIDNLTHLPTITDLDHHTADDQHPHDQHAVVTITHSTVPMAWAGL